MNNPEKTEIRVKQKIAPKLRFHDLFWTNFQISIHQVFSINDKASPQETEQTQKISFLPKF